MLAQRSLVLGMCLRRSSHVALLAIFCSQIRFQLEACATWQVSSLGRVKTLNGVIHHGYTGAYGYKHVKIRDKAYYVHRLVARVFHGPPPSPEQLQVNHLDSDPANNRADNLEYATPSENARHARAAGRWTRQWGPGRPIHCRHIGAQQCSFFPSQSQAARVLGLDLLTVSRCCCGLQQHANGYEFRFAEPAPLTGEMWQAARYPGITSHLRVAGEQLWPGQDEHRAHYIRISQRGRVSCHTTSDEANGPVQKVSGAQIGSSNFPGAAKHTTCLRETPGC